MFVLLHVVIALSSIGFATYLFFRPSKTKINVSYGLTGLTLATGTYLVISTHSPLLQACTTGLIYLSVVITLQLFARRKLLTSEL